MRSDGARKQAQHAAAAHLPEGKVGVADLCRACGEREVAGQNQLDSAGDGHAVHQRDMRLAVRRDAGEHPVHILQEAREVDRIALELLVALHVAPSTERAAGAGECHNAQRRIRGERLQRSAQLLYCGPVERIQLLGTVQSDERHAGVAHAERQALNQQIRRRSNGHALIQH